MIIHVIPRVYNPWSNVKISRLVGVDLPNFSLKLRADEIKIGKPLPNKNYTIGMLNQGRKALNGLLLEIPDCCNLAKFIVKVDWLVKVDDEEIQLTHTIINHITGTETPDCCLISHDAIMWHATNELTSKVPEIYKGLAPIDINPRLDLEKGLMDQVESVTLPFLEVARLHHSIFKERRYPTLSKISYS